MSHLRVKESAYSELYSYSTGINHAVLGKQGYIFTLPIYVFGQRTDHPLVG